MPPQAALAQLTTGHWVTQCLYIAAKLGAADALAAGPLPIDELAQKCGAHSRSLYRVLRALASVGVFEESGDGRFALTPMAECLRDTPGSMRAWMLMLGDPYNFNVWSELLHSVRTGATAFDHVHKMGFFEYMADHPEQGRVFDQAMTSNSGPEVAAVVEAYDFSGIGTLVDVAGGHGSMMEAILRANPGMKGVVADMASVLEGTRQRIAASGLGERFSATEMDFFKSIPAGADAYVLKHIIHDWEESKALAILKNCHTAMGPNGRLLLVEMVIEPGNGPGLGKWLDIAMLVYAGGCERTEAEYRDLLARAGFRLTRVVPTASPVSVIEAVPV